MERPRIDLPICKQGLFKKVPDGLIGESNEAFVTINSIPVRCLFDTGSTVSSISQSWYDAQLSEVPVKPLDTILEIECADGKNLPYSGNIEVDICLENTSGSFSFLLFQIADTMNLCLNF